MEEKVKSALDDLIKTESKKISFAVIEGESNIVESSEDWKVERDIPKIVKFWNEIEKQEKFIEERIKTLEEELKVLKEKEKSGDTSIAGEIIDAYKLLKSFYNRNLEYPTRIEISGDVFYVLQWNTNRLIAASMIQRGGVVGFKDEERRIIYKIDTEGSLPLGLLEASKELWKRSVKEPYMAPTEALGKELEWATPRILLDDTNNLQELGLLKFGLSIEESKVYLALLKKGSEGDTVGNLNDELDIKRTTIYRIMDRLIEKEWVLKLPGTTRSAQTFLARPIDLIFDERIKQKEEELKILKSFRFIIGESFGNGWIGFDKAHESIKEKAIDFKTLGITGVEKDCGLLVFEYGRPIEDDVIIRSALQLSCETLKIRTQVDEDIEEYTNPDLEDIKFEEIEIEDKYMGASMYLKFIEGSKTANNVGNDWILAVKLVAIPVEQKINVIWATTEKFDMLLKDVIFKLY